MTEWKSTNPTSSSSQSSIAAMKNFLADRRLTPLPPLHPLAHTLITPNPHAWPGVGNGMDGGCARAIPVQPTLLQW